MQPARGQTEVDEAGPGQLDAGGVAREVRVQMGDEFTTEFTRNAAEGLRRDQRNIGRPVTVLG